MFNIYCDESCHLENDSSDVMVLGAITCPSEKKKQVFSDIRHIKEQHGISSWTELKWTKISPAKLTVYLALVNYFFENKDLQFRAIVAKEKSLLDHSIYNDGDYNTWYYKIYYRLLEPITRKGQYRIFLDIKDTCGGKKVRKLQEVLANSKYDFSNEIIKDIKQIRSHESELMQITDIFIGALSYYHRNLFYKEGSSAAKNILIDHIHDLYPVEFNRSSALSEKKFNIFIWNPRRVR
ncbi:DUF3800 domain-containing protein [Paenibacillus barengoltzii]|uniref:DUF3800 domain-containing protein n=1 Tax=Paenibacillus barengoltzii TaxID=343517 RepID=UPI000FD880B8|nr:DUF3800 domain-containing protein [Paenibacillus barengoltzii]